MKDSRRSMLFIILAAFLWGVGDLFSKLAVDSVGPWQATFIRSVSFFPMVVGYVLYKKDLQFSLKKDSIHPILAGTFIGLGIIFSRLALSLYEVSLVKPIQRLSILITVILSTVFLNEKMTKLKLFGIALALAAFFLLYPLDSEFLSFHVGHLYLIALIISLGLSTVFLRQGILKTGVNYTRFFRALVQTVIIFSGFFILYGLTSLSISFSFELIYPVINGIFGGAAFILFCKGLKSVGASTAKPMMVLATITTVTLGIFVLGESLFLSKILGIISAIIAVILLSYKAGS